MAHNEELLTSYCPVDGVLLRLEQSSAGWTLWIRHRHQAGSFSDCRAEEFDQLTLEEALDIVDATIWMAGHELRSS